MNRTKIILSVLTLMMAAMLAVTPAALAAGNLDREVTFSIGSQTLDTALLEFSKQANVQLMLAAKSVGDRHSPGVSGKLAIHRALASLLEGTGLKYTAVGNTVTIEPAVSSSDAEAATTDSLRLAQANSQDVAGSAAAARSQSDETARQGASPGNDADNAQEIIVTATRRAERLLDVPMSVAVISSQDIERRGLVSQSDYLRSLPGVAQIEAGAGNTSINMRGVSANPQNFDRGAKATVGYYLNDIPLTGYVLRGGADIKLVDLARVEVIRGPQGTLYGSGSLGGTVRNIPNAPDLSGVKGNLDATFSGTSGRGDSNESIEGVLNVPLIADKLAIRAVGYWFENSGYIDNVAGSDSATLTRAANFGISDLAVNDTGVGGDKYVGGRLSLLWQPTDRFKATLTHLRQDITQDGLPDASPLLAGKYQQTRLQLGDIVGGGSERLEDNLQIHNATLEFNFPLGTLLSSSSLVQEDYLEKRDIGVFFGGAPPLPQRNKGETEAFAQELRFTSAFNGPLQVLAGLYYEDVQRDFLQQAFFGGRTNNPFTQVTYSNEFSRNTIEQKAIFGEVSYEWRQLELTLGARGFSYDENTDTTRSVSHTVATPSFIRLGGDNDGSTLKANLSYKPSERAMLYAQWSEGFRLGSPVSAANAACDQNNDGIIDGTGLGSGPRTLDPDNLDSFEVGTKFSLVGGALQIDAAAYRNTWTGVPIRIVIPCGFATEANAGEARTEGMEVSSQFSVTDNLALNFGASYVDAKLTEDAPLLGGLRGDRLPGSPKHTAYLGAEYEFDLFERPSFVRIDYTHVGGFYNNLAETGIEAGNYGLINTRAGMTFGQLGIDIFVKNLTDADDATWVDTVFTGAFSRVYLLRPRTVGVSARYQF